MSGKAVEKANENEQIPSLNEDQKSKSEQLDQLNIDRALNNINNDVSSSEKSTKDDSIISNEKSDLTTVPTRLYLHRTVVPILLQGMSEIVRNRPAKPIEALALYLNTNKEKYGE